MNGYYLYNFNYSKFILFPLYLIFNINVIMVIWSYYKVEFTDPGVCCFPRVLYFLM